MWLTVFHFQRKCSQHSQTLSISLRELIWSLQFRSNKTGNSLPCSHICDSWAATKQGVIPTNQDLHNQPLSATIKPISVISQAQSIQEYAYYSCIGTISIYTDPLPRQTILHGVARFSMFSENSSFVLKEQLWLRTAVNLRVYESHRVLTSAA